MITSRSLDDLHPRVRELAEQHIAACADASIELLVYCTFRDAEEQDRLYRMGRTAPGRIVTCARGGESMHNYRLAYDCVPTIGGKPQWDDGPLVRHVGVLGESVGLAWAGRWLGKLRESVHFQYTGGLALADLQAGKVPAA